MQHHITARWYRHPKFSDTTVKYGPGNFLILKSHRLVLCSNSSIWLWKFDEAGDNAVYLYDRYPDALEAIFEFCYTSDYTSALPTAGATDLEVAKNRYLLLVRILAVAERYRCEEEE
jgi:hypothetical protein